MSDLMWDAISALVIIGLGVKTVLMLKTWFAERRGNPKSKRENAFKGFVRDQKKFGSNFWGMVKAYRERAIKKLGWNE